MMVFDCFVMSVSLTEAIILPFLSFLADLLSLDSPNIDWELLSVELVVIVCDPSLSVGVGATPTLTLCAPKHKCGHNKPKKISEQIYYHKGHWKENTLLLDNYAWGKNLLKACALMPQIKIEKSLDGE